MEDQQRSREEITRLLDTVREMAVVVAKLEKRPTSVETPAETSEPDRVPPPPPPPAQYPHVPPVQPAVGQFEIPAPGMPMGVSLPRQTSSEAETVRPRQFIVGGGSDSQGLEQPHHTRERWDVERFLKNGGYLFYGSTNPEVALEWIDAARSVLIHLGCPPELWVRVATGAMQSMGRLLWDSAHTAFLEGRALERITWDEFREVFYSQYFSATVRAKKKMEFLSLRQQEGMSVAEYQSRFLMLERFALGSFSSERERAAQFVSGLRISLRAVVATFSCTTFAEAIMRALECEHAHDSHHQAKGTTPSGIKGQKNKAQAQQGPQPQRQRTGGGVTVYAAEGQYVQRFPQQTQTFQGQRSDFQEYPVCPKCQKRHQGACRRATGACFACGDMGHHAAECPRQPRP